MFVLQKKITGWTGLQSHTFLNAFRSTTEQVQRTALRCCPNARDQLDCLLLHFAVNSDIVLFKNNLHPEAKMLLNEEPIIFLKILLGRWKHQWQCLLNNVREGQSSSLFLHVVLEQPHICFQHCSPEAQTQFCPSLKITDLEEILSKDAKFGDLVVAVPTCRYAQPQFETKNS